MRHLGLFEGIGGFSLAARWAGWETVAVIEWDSYCQSVLKKNFENAIVYGDIRNFDGQPYKGEIDIITGGFPCQPFSAAGIGRGTDDDRYLWPEMLRVIREVAPRWVVAENVRGFVNGKNRLVFAQVQVDLEDSGYETLPCLLTSAGADGFDIRERIFILAYANGRGCPQDASKIRLNREAGSKQALAQQMELRRTRGGGIRGIPNSRVCRMSNGIPSRLDRYKGIGNAVNPKLVWRIFDTINRFEHEKTLPSQT